MMVREEPVPFSEFSRLLRFYPRGHVVRVAALLLAFTGCRVGELEKLSPKNLYEGWLYWRPGKRQKGWRSEYLPEWARAEIMLYRAENRVSEAKFLGVEPRTIRRYLHEDRAAIGGRWTEKKNGPVIQDYISRPGFCLQLKSFRKSFACSYFWREWQNLGDAGAAVEFTCARMGHSNKGITVTHYIKGAQGCEPEAWLRWFKGGDPLLQARLADFQPVKAQVYQNLLEPFPAPTLT